MSQAEELLATLSGEGATVNVDTSDEHMVIGNDRIVMVPNSLKRLAVQYDHDIETVTFDCPRYWDDHDMSQMKIYINYMRADKALGMYIAQNVEVDPVDSSIMHFTWTISRNVSEVKGNIAFLVCVKNADEEGNEINHWNSELCKECYISEGMECEEDLVAMYPDFVTEMLQRMDYVESIATPVSMQEYVDDYFVNHPNKVQDHVDAYFAANPPTNATSVQQYVNDYLIAHPDVVENLVDAYMNDNPEKMQEYVDEYFSNDEVTIEHINTFIEENMADLIANGLLEITKLHSIEKNGSASPTARGRALLESIEGHSYNAVYSGKNLLDISSGKAAERGVTFDTIYDKNGRPYNVKVTGSVKEGHDEDLYTILSSTSSFPLWAQKGVEYTAFVNNVGVSGLQMQVYEYLNDKWTHLGSANTKVNFVISDAATGLMVRLKVSKGYTVNAYAYPMIVLATETDLSFAPYNMGWGSPSPDYPEVIESACDSGWFDGEWISGGLRIADGAEYASTSYMRSNKIKCDENDTVLFDCGNNEVATRIFFYSDTSFISAKYNTNGNSYVESVAPSGTTYCRLVVYRDGIVNDDVKNTYVTINGTYALKLKAVGKNLVDIDETTMGVNYGVDFSLLADGGISLNGLCAQTSWWTVSKLNLKVGKYRITGCPSGGTTTTYSHGVGLKNSDGTKNRDINEYGDGNNVVFEITDSDMERGVYAIVYIKINKDVHYDNITFYPMLRKCDANGNPICDDTYEPYQENILTIPLKEPLRSIGETKDDICMVDGVYGVMRRVKYVTDKDLTWTAYTPSIGFTMGVVMTTADFTDRLVDNTCKDNALCSHFGGWPVDSLNIENKMSYIGKFALHSATHYYNYGYFFWNHPMIDFTATEVLAQWNSWRSDKVIDIYYKINPVFEPFEDQSVFYEIPSYDEATNISIVEDSENVKPIINIRLPKNEDGSLLTVDYTTSKRNEAVLADGRVKFRVTEDGELEASIFVEEEV